MNTKQLDMLCSAFTIYGIENVPITHLFVLSERVKDKGTCPKLMDVFMDFAKTYRTAIVTWREGKAVEIAISNSVPVDW